jgi:phosphoketolase
MSVWRQGYGVIEHTSETVMRIEELIRKKPSLLAPVDGVVLDNLLKALDRLTSAALWLVVHETYARNVYLDGRPLEKDDFKIKPEGHTGGALNMVPAYAGYLAANVVSGFTRSWLMGQGHCVAAVDSLNLLVGNVTAGHAQRYAVSDTGLTRYVRDFYSYLLNREGKQDSPLGSHVNAHTAGGISEGGYLGFAELQYIHMPLPGERLVVFLSDGAFEEQRGSDWAPRWWRNEDSGWATPIMIKNGRRIDQRTTMSQQGGTEWLLEHLRLNGFDPFVFDGRDPLAFLWAILEMEDRLETAVERLERGEIEYPVRLPYGIATAPKGAGFPGEGTNLAHNLPLLTNPWVDEGARHRFNEAAQKLWVPPDELEAALMLFQKHEVAGRVRERDHALVDRNPTVRSLPDLPTRRIVRGQPTHSSPMQAVDEVFSRLVEANPQLRPRVGNPDEMKSNRLLRTLEVLKFRVTHPEADVPESVHGSVITALNEEAVASAALANKGGINLVHTYEAFGTKMLGAVRQEVIFARNCVAAGRPQRWLSLPVIMTSHTWENGKNEHSHQDPTFAEAMMGEAYPFSRVVFPADFNTAAAVTAALYQTRAQIWTLVVPKADTLPDLFDPQEAAALVDAGVLRLKWAGHRQSEATLCLAAVGAYQLEAVLLASRRLAERDLPHTVLYILEPNRLDEALWQSLLPDHCQGTVIATHTRPQALQGLLAPMHNGSPMKVLGYRNEGGTLDTNGMLMVNRSTWAHIAAEAAMLSERGPDDILTVQERDAVTGRISPQGILFPSP